MGEYQKEICNNVPLTNIITRLMIFSYIYLQIDVSILSLISLHKLFPSQPDYTKSYPTKNTIRGIKKPFEKSCPKKVSKLGYLQKKKKKLFEVSLKNHQIQSSSKKTFHIYQKKIRQNLDTSKIIFDVSQNVNKFRISEIS